MQELKPCPCCGSSNGLYVLQDEKYGEWSVFCDMCKTSLHNEDHCDTREDAVSAWNRRAERTCRVVSAKEFGGVGYAPGCSECGWQMADSMWHNYCPNCGSRVVDTDDA